MVLLTQTLINGPHFILTYILVYNSRENVRRYPFAGVWIPLALVALGVLRVDPMERLAPSRSVADYRQSR